MLQEDEALHKGRATCKSIKTTEAQISWLSPPNSCCQGLLSVSPFTFFPPYQAERDPHPALDAERRLLLSGGAAAGVGGAGER